MSEVRHYKLFTRLILEKWQNQKIELNPGATEQEIVQFEKLLSCVLPSDIRYFFSVVNGMRGYSDNYEFHLWSLNEISSSNYGIIINQPPFIHKTAFIFGDFFIDSHRYYFVIEDTGSSFVEINDSNFDVKIAESFSKFLDLYLTDPEKLNLWIKD